MDDATQNTQLQYSPEDGETLLIPLENDLAIVIGPNAEGLEKITDQLVLGDSLNDLVASVGEIAAAGGGVASAANAFIQASGLYRLDIASQALLADGATLTQTAGGGVLGVIRGSNGQFVRNARLLSVTSARLSGVLAAVGPAIATVALQMQLSDISKHIRSVQQVSEQTLQVLTSSRKADYQGACETITEVYRFSVKQGKVSDSNWDTVSGLFHELRSHRNHYKGQIQHHIDELRQAQRDVTKRRDYLRLNAQNIIIDACAAFETLQAWVCLSILKRSHELANGEPLTLDLPEIQQEIETDLQTQRELLYALIRELHVIADTTGKWTIPLTQKRGDSKVSQETAQKLLEALDGLAQQLGIRENPQPEPTVTCAPEDYDTSAYTDTLRWFLDQGEELCALAFPVDRLSHRLLAKAASPFAEAIEIAWAGLPQREDTKAPAIRNPGQAAGFLRRAAQRSVVVSPEMVAVTNRRVITASPQDFIQKGTVTGSYPLEELTWDFLNEQDSLAQLHVTHEERQFEWCFPHAGREAAQELASLLKTTCAAFPADTDPLPALAEADADGELSPEN